MKSSAMPESNRTKILLTLMISVFAAMLGSAIVVPLLPVYVRNHGAGGLMIGGVFAAFSLSRTIFLPYFGRLSDRRGRKRLLLAGLLLCALCTIFYILSKEVYHIILTRAIQGIGAAMIWPLAAAYVGDMTPKGREGTYMGWFNMASFSGMACGPFLGGIINDLVGIEGAFASMGLITMVGFFMVISFLPKEEIYRVVPKKKPKGTIQLLRSEPVLRGMFLFRFLYTICVALIWSFQPIYLDAFMGLKSSWIGLLVSLNVGAAAMLQAPMGRLADRVSRSKLIMIGAVLQTIAVTSLPFCRTLPELLAANLGFGLAGGFSLPAIQAVATDLGRARQSMGGIMAVLLTGQSVGMLIGPMAGGALYDLFDLHLIFMIAGGVALFSIAPVAHYLNPRLVAAFSADQSEK